MKMRVIALFALCVAAVAAVPAFPGRIVGGSVTTINQYPTMAAVLSSPDLISYWQSCGGTILNNRSILSAAHCTWGQATNRFRFRVGSTWANSGGVVHIVQSILHHPNFTPWTMDMDLVILRSSSVISHNNNVQPAAIAGPNYFLADNQVVWAAGWGLTSEGGSPSEQLRHVQVYSINEAFCRSRYGFLTNNMFCAGVQNVGGRDTCQQDSGGPLFHNGVVVGVTFFGSGCARPEFPGLYVFVPRASQWIGQNA